MTDEEAQDASPRELLDDVLGAEEHAEFVQAIQDEDLQTT